MVTCKKTVIAGTLVATTLVSVCLYGQQSSGRANRRVVAPRQELVKSVIDDAYAKLRSDTTGKNADYIGSCRSEIERARWFRNGKPLRSYIGI